MDPHELKVEHGIDASAALATVALRIVLIVGLAGCASVLTSTPNGIAADATPYVGVFTGEFVDGKPLYRFPTIEVVGSRSSVAPGR